MYTHNGAGADVSPAAVNARLVAFISSAAVVLAVLLSGFVYREPAPYELYMAALMPVWALFGLRISRHVTPLLTLLVLFGLGGVVSMSQLPELGDAPLSAAVTLFLGLTAVFFAAVVEARPGVLPLIFGAWVVAASGTALVGIVGYFNLVPGADIFTRYGRAAGAFQDPNVFGPYLTLPGLFLLHRMMTGGARTALLATPFFIIVTLGVFFSFSRGAWGLFSVTALLLTLALFTHNRGALIRLRIVVMSLTATAIAVLTLLVALQIPEVAELFSARAQLVQEYDGARLGRFARHFLGFALAMERPLGIGMHQFGQIFGEDPHNIWLKALLEYSWLGFAAYFTLVVWTAAAGFRILFRARPWQPYLLCAYIAFLGQIGLATVIDIHHWRHLYLTLGMIWGMIALEQRHQAALAARRPLAAV